VPGCAGSPRTGLAGDGDGQPRWPPSRLASQRQTHPPLVARGGPTGSAAAQEEASDRYRYRRGCDVTDSSERDLGDGLSVRHDRRWPHHEDVERDRRVHPRSPRDRGRSRHRADGVVDVLDRLALTHGAPHYVRFDNGPEFVAHAASDWCRFNGAGSLFIDPGSPWQNAWIESFNGRLRDELLNSWRFDSLLEARVISRGLARRLQRQPAPLRPR
jgi:transposase InsO family protein